MVYEECVFKAPVRIVLIVLKAWDQDYLAPYL